MTNAGLSIRLPLIRCWSSFIGKLRVEIAGESLGDSQLVGISMSGDLATGRFIRRHYPDVPIPLCHGVEELQAPLTDIFVPTRNTGRWEAPPSLLQDMHTSCRAGVLLSFGSREDFLEIRTVPPGRFSIYESILEICPSNGNRAGRPDWNAQILHEEPGSLNGATIAEFTLKRGDTETILFVVTSFRMGSRVYPVWHYCRLTIALKRAGLPGLLSDFLLRVEHSSASALPETVYHHCDMVKQAIVNPNYADVVNSTADDSYMSVSIAPNAFLTTTASVLKHVHVAVSSKKILGAETHEGSGGWYPKS